MSSGDGFVSELRLYIMHLLRIMAYIVLEDQSTFGGESVGASGIASGEVCFTTSMTGYQESVPDPSYAAQVLVFSYPLVGNYGVDDAHVESNSVHARAVVMRQSRPAWSDWLGANDVVALEGVNTRALVEHIREAGAMRCAIGDADPDELLDLAMAEPHIDYERGLAEPALAMAPLAPAVSTSHPYSVGQGPRVVVVDLGCKRSVVAGLAGQGLEVVVVPAHFEADEILSMSPAAVLVGNGPGDPAQLTDQIATVRELLGTVPLFGICLGHQLLGLALGMSTFKLPFGHRGANHPVRDLRTSQVMVTSHNHGFAVSPSDSKDVSLVSLNDGTVEGIAGDGYSSVQFHPEASPGTSDASWFFEEVALACHRARTYAAS